MGQEKHRPGLKVGQKLLQGLRSICAETILWCSLLP